MSRGRPAALRAVCPSPRAPRAAQYATDVANAEGADMARVLGAIVDAERIQDDGPRPRVVVGRDTRPSSDVRPSPPPRPRIRPLTRPPPRRSCTSWCCAAWPPSTPRWWTWAW